MCCKADSLKGFVFDLKAKIDRLKVKAKEQTQRTLTNLIAYKLMFFMFTRVGFTLASGIKHKTHEERIQIYNEYHPPMDAIINWIKQNKDFMVENQQKCLDRFKSIRSEAVCYTCSARADTFFDKDRLHVHEDTCRAIVTDCRLGWLYLIEFIDKVNSFYDLVRMVDFRYQLKLMDSVSGSPAKTVLDWAEKTGIKSQLKKCTEGSCNFETTKNICDNFVSIDQPLYLQEALKIVDEVTKKNQKSKRIA